MSRCVHLCALAVAVTVADLMAFILCFQVLCQAWGSNRWFMCSLFTAMFVWTQSLANLWRAGLRGLRSRQMSEASSASVLPLAVSDEGRHSDV